MIGLDSMYDWVGKKMAEKILAAHSTVGTTGSDDIGVVSNLCLKQTCIFLNKTCHCDIAHITGYKSAATCPYLQSLFLCISYPYFMVYWEHAREQNAML